MCACEWNWRCARCKAAPWEKLEVEGDEVSPREREEADAERLWREQIGVFPRG